MSKTEKLAVFSHLNGAWAACGLLRLTEDGAQTLGSRFAYGTRYLDRSDFAQHRRTRTRARHAVLLPMCH